MVDTNIDFIKIDINSFECSICLDNIDLDDIHELKCGHIFHKECINNWFKQDSIYKSCPYCRAINMKKNIHRRENITRRRHNMVVLQQNDINYGYELINIKEMCQGSVFIITIILFIYIILSSIK